jgi:taurine dioxygenase
MAMAQSAAAIRVIPTGTALGAEIRGIDLAKGVSGAEFAVIKKAWLDHLVLLFRGQTLSDVQLQEFAGLFGPLDLAPPNVKGSPWLPDTPHLTVISNVKENGKPIGSLDNGEAIWHTDMSYQELPPTASLLYCLECPPQGGDTWFANMYLAYERLPDDLKSRVAGRRAIHDATYNSGGQLRKGFKDISDPREAPGARHPIIRTHPETARKALYLGRRRNNYVIDTPLDESEKLLDKLWGQMTRDEYVWKHHWQVGDLLVWDNRCTMHRRDSFDDKHRRVMHRAQVRGTQPVE